jgi:hypothetical protein
MGCSSAPDPCGRRTIHVCASVRQDTILATMNDRTNSEVGSVRGAIEAAFPANALFSRADLRQHTAHDVAALAPADLLARLAYMLAVLDAPLAAGYVVDAVEFLFAAPTPRRQWLAHRLTPAQLRAVRRWLAHFAADAAAPAGLHVAIAFLDAAGGSGRVG